MQQTGAATAFQTGTRWASGRLGRLVVVRLAPREDVKRAIEAIAEAEGLAGALILGGAASLRRVTLRNVRVAPERWPITDSNRIWTTLEGPLELVSIMGNISRWPDGRPFVHAHVVVSTGRPDGVAYGGHLVDGAEVLTAGELALAEVLEVRMRRDRDPGTLGEELFPDTT